jgi:hypothetical protein
MADELLDKRAITLLINKTSGAIIQIQLRGGSNLHILPSHLSKKLEETI